MKCRPPNNRAPTKEEISNCQPFLKLQIKIINPKIIVCLGAIAVQSLLGKKEPISSLRGQWFHYENAKILATFHPSYGLRVGTKAKDQICEDLQTAINEL